jgi:uncharacterized protein YndB with AHSA1/START domain
MNQEKTMITVEAHISAPVEKVWQFWTEPEHITQWNFASDDWQCPRATNDLRVGGAFSFRMEDKDGSAGFDFGGTYTDVIPEKHIAYTMGENGRSAEVTFNPEEGGVHVAVTFVPETENPLEMQRSGWQAILDNFKKHVENN